ncbi:MAG: hypothetical protein JXQ96_11160 [Cyclobacteriaceae bacterium]
MKLRILNNSLRLRLSQSEVDQLKSEDQVSGKTSFTNSDLLYSFVISDTEDDVSGDFSGGHLKIKVSKNIAKNWVDSDEVGFENKDQSALRILVEKDFQCLHKRPKEDESDSFPNPLAEAKS